ncbi:MAG: ABC transporter permease [Pseudomonadota bacterium]
MTERITIYSSSTDRLSYAGSLQRLIQQIRTHHWHISQMFNQNFTNAYRFTRFGAVWNYILPMVPITVWVLLNGLRLFPSFGDVSSVVYVTLGITLWFLFAGCVTLPINTVESKVGDAARSELPLITFVIASFAQLSFDTLVRLVATIIVFALFHGLPAITVFLTPLIAVFALIFFCGVGLLLAVFNLAYRDINKITTMLLQYGMLLSAIVFPVSRIPMLAEASIFNPFFIFVDSIRTLTVFGEIRHPVPLATFSILGILISVLACRLFFASEQRIKGFV